MLGALLMVVAGLGTFLAWHRASPRPGTAYVVADRPLPPGHRIEPGDVRLASFQLAGATDGAALTEADAASGRVTLGPVGEGELLQAGNLSERDPGWLAEVAFSLPRDQAVDGRLRSGDRVDLLVTDDDRTRTVAESVPVIGLGEAGTSVSAAGTLAVTVGVEDSSQVSDIVHAVRVGEVTLVRSTFVGDAEGDSS